MPLCSDPFTLPYRLYVGPSDGSIEELKIHKLTFEMSGTSKLMKLQEEADSSACVDSSHSTVSLALAVREDNQTKIEIKGEHLWNDDIGEFVLQLSFVQESKTIDGQMRQEWTFRVAPDKREINETNEETYLEWLDQLVESLEMLIEESQANEQDEAMEDKVHYNCSSELRFISKFQPRDFMFFCRILDEENKDKNLFIAIESVSDHIHLSVYHGVEGLPKLFSEPLNSIEHAEFIHENDSIKFYVKVRTLDESNKEDEEESQMEEEHSRGSAAVIYSYVTIEGHEFSIPIDSLNVNFTRLLDAVLIEYEENGEPLALVQKVPSEHLVRKEFKKMLRKRNRELEEEEESRSNAVKRTRTIAHILQHHGTMEENSSMEEQDEDEVTFNGVASSTPIDFETFLIMQYVRMEQERSTRNSREIEEQEGTNLENSRVNQINRNQPINRITSIPALSSPRQTVEVKEANDEGRMSEISSFNRVRHEKLLLQQMRINERLSPFPQAFIEDDEIEPLELIIHTKEIKEKKRRNNFWLKFIKILILTVAFAIWPFALIGVLMLATTNNQEE